MPRPAAKKLPKNESRAGGGGGFNVEQATAEEWLAQDPKYAEVVKPFSMCTNLAKRPLGQPDRWIIDFADMELEEAEGYEAPL